MLQVTLYKNKRLRLYKTKSKVTHRILYIYIYIWRCAHTHTHTHTHTYTHTHMPHIIQHTSHTHTHTQNHAHNVTPRWLVKTQKLLLLKWLVCLSCLMLMWGGGEVRLFFFHYKIYTCDLILLPFSSTVSLSVHVFSCDCNWYWCLFCFCCPIQHTMFRGSVWL